MSTRTCRTIVCLKTMYYWKIYFHHSLLETRVKIFPENHTSNKFRVLFECFCILLIWILVKSKEIYSLYFVRGEYFRIWGHFMLHWTVLHYMLCNCDVNQAMKCGSDKNLLLYCLFCIAVFSLRGSHYRNKSSVLPAIWPSKILNFEKAAKQRTNFFEVR